MADAAKASSGASAASKAEGVPAAGPLAQAVDCPLLCLPVKPFIHKGKLALQLGQQRAHRLAHASKRTRGCGVRPRRLLNEVSASERR